MAKRSPAASTISAETIASVRGILITKRVPCPGTLCSAMLPPMRSMLVFTTSMPTPRPDTAVTLAAVEKPGRRMKRWICVSSIASRSAGVAIPLARIRARMRSTGRPCPSSAISIMMWPPSWKALRVIWPVSDLPASSRSVVDSSP